MVEILNEAQFNASRDYLNTIDPMAKSRYWLGLSYQALSGSFSWISSQNPVLYSNWNYYNSSVTTSTCVTTLDALSRTWAMTGCWQTSRIYAFCRGPGGKVLV
jgi:hypothetical protein